jgi:serine/threonine-protein kinase
MADPHATKSAEAVTEVRATAQGETVQATVQATPHGTLQSAPGDIADPDAEMPSFPAEQRYETRASLGEGGMGEVRLCRDRVIGREVALKAVLRPHAAKGELRARFIREARVQGQLEHPAIVPVYDFGTDADGQPFFTMKRVRGVTLERVIDALQRGDAATARLYSRHKLLAAFVQVCLAIDFAHERGVIHRDLKPSNVMLGGYGEVYVLDWGVAKVRSASSTMAETSSVPAIRIDDGATSAARVDTGEKSAPTAAGAVLGTPGYMAPEQLRGDEVDPRTDVYALGGILFELLTLQPLHGTGTLAAMMKRALEGADARASVRAADREVPPELEEVCVRACAVDRAQRYASAREIADAVDAYLSGDRDLELRRALAMVHLDRARDASSRARVPDAPPSERTEALREVGRAVALDPSSTDALALLVTMLTQPPKVPPPEVVATVETARAESQRRMLPRIAVIYALAWFLFLPLQAYSGILDIKLIAAPLVAWAVAAAGVVISYRVFARWQDVMKYQIIVSAAAIGISSLVFGPLLLLPTIVGMSTMGTILVTRRDRRPMLFVCNGLALLVPTVLAWTGHFPIAHAVDGDRTIRIGLAAFAVTRDGLFGILALTNLLLVFIGAKFAMQYRDALTAAETKSEIQAWQLKQLVPAEAARALGRRVP